MSAYRGVDTAVWRGRVLDAELPSSTFWNQRRLDASTGEVLLDKKMFRLPESGAIAIVRSRRGRPTSASIQASLPKETYGTNLECLQASEALENLVMIDEEAGHYLHWQDRLAERELTRLDLVGHFVGVEHRDTLLRGLEATIAPRHKSRLYNDPLRGGALTLQVRVGRRFSVTLYDKEAEILHQIERARAKPTLDVLAASKGVLRCEVRLHNTELASAGLGRVKGLEHIDLASIHMERFYRAGFDRKVSSLNHVIRNVHIGPLPTGEQRTLLYYLLCEALGQEPMALASRSRRKFRSLARAMGVAPVDLLDSEPLFLDYGSGLLCVGSSSNSNRPRAVAQ